MANLRRSLAPITVADQFHLAHSSGVGSSSSREIRDERGDPQWRESQLSSPCGIGVVGCCGFSRFLGGWMIPSRAAHDVLEGMLRVLGQFGGVPRHAVWDQEGCIGAWKQGRQVLTREFQAFRGTLTECQGRGYWSATVSPIQTGA